MGRTLLILSGVAALSTVLALLVQDRALSGDLRAAAQRRVDTAADATSLLVTSHLDAMAERYRAVSGTPQLRATLEVGDVPTLRYYAEQLAEREGAAVIAFVDRSGGISAVVGDSNLASQAALRSGQGLIDVDGHTFAVVAVPLRTGGETVGRLVAAEPVDAGLLGRWSHLCGAEVSFEPARAARRDVLERVVLELDELELRAAVSLEAERAALAHSRFNLLFAGAVAIALAFVVSWLVSRSLVGPILQIRNLAQRIGRGDLNGRLDVSRRDEIGEVADAVDTMLDHLREYRGRVESQHRELAESVEELRSSQVELANAQRLAHIGSWQLDPAKGLLQGSEEFRALFGLGGPHNEVDPNAVLARVHPDDRVGVEESLRTCFEDGLSLHLDCRVARDGEADRILHVQAHRVGAEGEVGLRLKGTVQDVSDRKRSEEQIRYLAYHDSLTGLGNRLQCRERIAIQLIQARRSESVLGVLFIDLDRFKRINDTLGHSAGDELLKGVADRIVASVRATDYVGRNDINQSVSRLGGDEFTVIVTDPTDVQDLAMVARRILAALSSPFDLGGHEVVISGSIGITAYPFDGDDAESLLRNADAAMYHAKEQGRNNYQFYTETMNEAAMRRLILEGKLRRALETKEFELHYQPKICLASGRLTGVEALIRWRDPESGIVSPGVFIPLAEETGLIVPLGDWVIRAACAQIAEWSAAGHRWPVSINLSIKQFASRNLVERILEVVDDAGIEPALLEVEITESTLMHDERALVAELERLRERGVRVSVDDFGTGYSSFAYLRRLPVDAIKIDRSFVKDIEDSEADAELTASIVGMGRALGLRVIAEGVETEGQRDRLAGWGCHEMQGFLYCRPLPPDDLVERLEDEGAAG